MASFYEITEIDAHGNAVSFEQFRGKVVYGVNVASECGYTASGYALLARLSKLKDLGVEVALFPCNQFGAQEVMCTAGKSSTISLILIFCVEKYSLEAIRKLKAFALAREWRVRIYSPKRMSMDPKLDLHIAS